MPVRVEHMINAQTLDAGQGVGVSHDFQGVTPKRVTFYVAGTETGTETMTFTVELSPDDGANLIDYVKLLDSNGTDAPAASVVLTSTGDVVFSMSPEDVVDYLKLSAVGATMNGGNNFLIDVWMVYSY